MRPEDGQPLGNLLAACEVLMSDVGEASMRAVATQALSAYADLDEASKLSFFCHVTTAYDVDAEQVKAAFHRWENVRGTGLLAGEELIGLFEAVEPARQQLLRRINYAPGATLALVEMRSDLRRLISGHPGLRPLDHDFHHLLTSWFNRGFLHMTEVTWTSPPALRRHLLHYETVHPMATEAELRRRLQPQDRRVYAFFHPATGDVPLVFVEVALVRGMPQTIAPLLDPGPALDPSTADTAALYSINNALDGLAGVSFGSLLIKQVIEQVSSQLPHLRQFVTLSPIPGFRRWLDAKAQRRRAAAVARRPVRRRSGSGASRQPPGRTAARTAASRPAVLPDRRATLRRSAGGSGCPVPPGERRHRMATELAGKHLVGSVAAVLRGDGQLPLRPDGARTPARGFRAPAQRRRQRATQEAR